jgi:hypothetical protein
MSTLENTNKLITDKDYLTVKINSLSVAIKALKKVLEPEQQDNYIVEVSKYKYDLINNHLKSEIVNQKFLNLIEDIFEQIGIPHCPETL